MSQINNQLSSELCRNCATPVHSHHTAMGDNGIVVAMGKIGNKWVDCSAANRASTINQMAEQSIRKEIVMSLV